MKKIALLMTGEMRQLWLTAPSIYKNVIEPNGADVFLYLNDKSLEPRTGDDASVVNAVFSDAKRVIFTDDAYADELDWLVKKNYSKIDGVYKALGRDKWDKQLNWHNTDQYLKLKKCAEAAVKYATANNFTYDLMLRVRPDIGWLNKFDLLRHIEPGTVYCNRSLHNCSITDDAHNVDWVEDTCFFGDQDSMLKFCSAFSDKMVADIDVCDEKYDLTFATEKLLAKVLTNTGLKIDAINNYFNYNGEGWIRPKLSKHFVDWTKSPNFHLIEKFCTHPATQGNAVYFDRISEIDVVMDPAIK